MRIENSTLRMDASHAKTQQQEVRTSLRALGADERSSVPVSAVRIDSVADDLSMQMPLSVQSDQSPEAVAIEESIDAVENDPMLRLIRAMILMLTGHEAKIFDARQLSQDDSGQDPVSSAAMPSPPSAATAAGSGVTIVQQTSYSESEETRLQVDGVVRAADGREFGFSLSLEMSRHYHEVSELTIRLGDVRQKKDPLVINFGGNAAQLTSQRFAFDLDADGQAEHINYLSGGSGFLVFDRNADGRVNDGSELFGAISGDGFADLATFDDDGNGWIDEGDEIFTKLRVWTPFGEGQGRLRSLEEVGAGAIGLSHVATRFDLRDNGNDLLGQIRSTGVYLRENGSVGTLQQIDLTV